MRKYGLGSSSAIKRNMALALAVQYKEIEPYLYR
jgi:hypothetical protein